MGSLLIVQLKKLSPDSDSETSLKTGQYLTKLRRTKQSVPVFWATMKSLHLQGQRIAVAAE